MSLFIIGFRLSFVQVRLASRLMVGLNSQARTASYYQEKATISFISMVFLLYYFVYLFGGIVYFFSPYRLFASFVSVSVWFKNV